MQQKFRRGGVGALALLVVIGTWVQSRVSCAQPPAENPRLEAEQALRLDPLADRELLTAGPKERSTWLGAVVDGGCFYGVDAARAQARMERIEAALTLSLAQLNRCNQSLGFAEIPNVISVLRRTRIFCEATGGMASMAMLYPYLNRSRISARSLKRYEMSLAIPSFKDPTQQQSSQPSFEKWTLEDLAAVLAHEAMHVLPVNNRDWHNSLQGRAKFGCEKSTYEDRVYLVEGACFPASRGGVVLYADNGPWRCPEVCEEALTGVDPLTAEQLRPLPLETPEGSRGVYGEPLLTRPYAMDEARTICAKVQTLRGKF